MKADILIVVDHVSEARLLSSFLRQSGYTTRQALDGEMGKLAVNTRIPDLILVETRLSYLDGYRFCQQLRDEAATERIPILFLLSPEEEAARVKALRVGGNDYLFKPYNLEELGEKTRYYLEREREREQLRQEVSRLEGELHLLKSARRSPKNTPEYLDLLRTAIDTIHNGIVITDATRPDHPIVYVNPGFERMTGYTAGEVIGKNCRFLQGDDRDQGALEELRRTLQNDGQCCVTLRNYRKDGTLFWNEISISPIFDPEGRPIYFIGIQTDVTERKRAEEELQRSRAAVGQMNRELHRLNDHLHRLANLDGLTGVANRRCFDERLELEWQMSYREKKPLSLIACDIDYFKRYNDTYSHLEGDDCLRAVASTLARRVHRPSDLVARCGGEEFSVLLPNTPIEGALVVAETIRAAVAELQIPHAASDVTDTVTMSLGVATVIPTPGTTSKDLRARADNALYEAKARGRNRVVSDSEEASP
jgi:diguanylate cyclase (GGDEF)-like protein/PAS domain S-box-containing protein